MTDPVYTIDNFVPNRSIGYLVKQVARLGSTRMDEQLAGGNLTTSHWIAMMLVKHGLADNCAMLARSLGHNSGAITRLVDQLEERGLISRCRDCGDRRIVTIDVTAAGHAQLQVMTPAVLAVWNEALTGFSRAEIETLLALLGRLVTGLEGRTRSTGAEA